MRHLMFQGMEIRNTWLEQVLAISNGTEAESPEWDDQYDEVLDSFVAEELTPMRPMNVYQAYEYIARRQAL